MLRPLIFVSLLPWLLHSLTVCHPPSVWGRMCWELVLRKEVREVRACCKPLVALGGWGGWAAGSLHLFLFAWWKLRTGCWEVETSQWTLFLEEKSGAPLPESFTALLQDFPMKPFNTECLANVQHCFPAIGLPVQQARLPKVAHCVLEKQV